MTNSFIGEMIQILEENGKKVCENPEEAEPFRVVEEKIESWFLDENKDEISAELFIIYLFLLHILSVLTGDIRYHGNSEKLYQEIFFCVGSSFCKLAELLGGKANSEHEFYESLRKLIKIYLANVKEINKLITQKR